MSIVRKILMALGCLVAAGLSAWLRYGDVDAARRWLSSRPPPVVAASAPAVREEALPEHQSFAGTAVTARDGVMVLHFRRSDTLEETAAKAIVKVFDMDGAIRKEIGVWGVFRHEASLGASVARFTVGGFAAGSYRVAADLESQRPLGVKRAAIEVSSMDGEPSWADLVKAR